jgi:hypothetical protein
MDAPLRQRRELSDILQTALQLYVQHFSMLFRIAAIVIPLGIVSGILQASIKNDAVALAAIASVGLVQVFVNLLATAALISALADIGTGKAPDFGRAYDSAFERLATLFGAIIRVTFHVLLFAVTIVGIPWAIQRSVRWLFVSQAVMLEGTNAKDALSRSAEAVLGSWWRTFGILVLASVLAAVPVVIVSASFRLTPIAVGSTANAAIDALVLPFIVLATTLLYFDLNARKESDAQLSAA